MPRGLGKLQLEIKRILQRAWGAEIGPLTFAAIRYAIIMKRGGNPARGDRLNPTHERSLKRAMKGLVDRGDVVIVSGKGGQTDPYRYATVEAFASATGEAVQDTAHAKRIVAELQEAVATAGPGVRLSKQPHPGSRK